jgi:membrane-associated phospholipid phosphatase
MRSIDAARMAEDRRSPGPGEVGTTADRRRPPRRQPLIVAALVVASLLAFAPLAAQAWEKDAFAWDREVSEGIHAYENEETILDAYVDPFDLVLKPPVQLLGLVVVIVVVAALLRKGRRRPAAFVALGVGVVVVLGPVLKEVFARPSIDPDGTGDTFPSGHAIRSMAAATSLAVVAWPTRWRWSTAVVGAIVVVLIGIAVVYHEWHWATDVLGAWLLVVAWLSSLWLALRPSA